MKVESIKECLHYLAKEKHRKKTFGFFAGICFRQFILHKFELPYIETFITTKCNLSCRYCSNLIPFYEKKMHYSMEEIKGNLELLLSKIDRLYRLKIHGGEVFLHPQLCEIISYVGKHPKIKSVRLTTNGTIIPPDKVLKAIADSKIVVQISDYHLSESKIPQLMEKLEAYGVKYVYLKEQKWFDMGECEKRPQNQFDECTIKRCTSLFEGKIYVCSRAAIMEKLGVVPNEGVPITLSRKKLKKECKKLYGGQFRAACGFCDGDTEYATDIKAGEQMK